MAATNINRVVLTGQPHARPRAALPAERHVRLLAADRVQHAPQGPATGEWEDKPNYFDVTVWGAQGENCARFLSKGRPVAIDGRLEWREWEDQDGNKRQASRSSPTPSSSSAAATTAGGGGGGGFTPRSDVPVDTRDFQPAGARAGGGSSRAGGRRHPVLGRRSPVRRARGPPGGAAAVLATLSGRLAARASCRARAAPSD